MNSVSIIWYAKLDKDKQAHPCTHKEFWAIMRGTKMDDRKLKGIKGYRIQPNVIKIAKYDLKRSRSVMVSGSEETECTSKEERFLKEEKRI